MIKAPRRNWRENLSLYERLERGYASLMRREPRNVLAIVAAQLAAMVGVLWLHPGAAWEVLAICLIYAGSVWATLKFVRP